MQALVFDEANHLLRPLENHPKPQPGDDEALVRVLRAGICSTDLQILRGYVPGYHGVLGHEFVGVVEACSCQPHLVGRRVVGEINCNVCKYTCADAVFTRNHAPGRTVLGIIAKDGTMAQWLTLPAANLHTVPDSLTDQEACFTEPLAAACRVLEQKVTQASVPCKIAVIGCGKLGLLVAAVLVAAGHTKVTLLGRNAHKMALVQGLDATVLLQRDAPSGPPVDTDTALESCATATSAHPPAASCDGESSASVAVRLSGQFDVCIEASGSSAGIQLALPLLRPQGTLVLKSTVAPSASEPAWSAMANDIVVNEKVLLGSRCGPMDMALSIMAEHVAVRQLLNAMVSHVVPLSQAIEAMGLAATPGVIKVQLQC
ncbi:GroES-like protein [Haematococcus lacustris]